MAKMNPILFLKQVRQEITKVNWPTQKETTVTVAMVLFLAFLASLYLLLADTLIATFLNRLLG